MRKKVIMTVLWLAILVTACQNAPVADDGQEMQVPGGSYRNIAASDLKPMLENKDFVLVNVHVPFAGNISGTDLSIPYDQIAEKLVQLPVDKSAKILLYCRSGNMSATAAETLVNLGYNNVWNLEGGMVAWEEIGMQIQK